MGVLIFNILPDSLKVAYVIISSSLALTYFVPLDAKYELNNNWSNVFNKLFSLASSLLVLGVLFKQMNWPDAQLFGAGVILLLISIFLIFFPKVQEVYLQDMKRILLRILILLIAGFYTFL